MSDASVRPLEATSLDVVDVDLDGLIEPALLAAITVLDGRAPLLAGMVRYHLGYAGRHLEPLDPRTVDRGKRIRPAVALLAAAAAGEIRVLPPPSARHWSFCTTSR